jgi:hypothetical protein
MSDFRKYDHLEKLEHPECRDIDIGNVYVFPKIDGTNASVWATDGHVFSASRTRVLDHQNERDNAGFDAWVKSEHPVATALRELCLANPQLIFYGEWLVPHSLRTYREEAWRRFYVFDVYSREQQRYLSFDEYQPLCDGIDYVMPLCILENPSKNQILNWTEKNTYLIDEGKGVGEGVVLKNYQWRNAHGRQPWAKLVRNEFKEANARIFGIPTVKGESQVEAEIVHEFASATWVRKEFAKVVTAVATDLNAPLDVKDGTYDEFVATNRGKIIPRTLGTLFHVFVEEFMWSACKKHKNPTIDFSKLNKLLTIRTKAVLTELF